LLADVQKWNRRTCIDGFGKLAGLALGPGWTRAGFAFAVAMIAAVYSFTARYTRVSPLFFLSCPISALLFTFAVLRSTFVAMKDGGITWRGTKYSLAELRKKNL